MTVAVAVVPVAVTVAIAVIIRTCRGKSDTRIFGLVIVVVYKRNQIKSQMPHGNALFK